MSGNAGENVALKQPREPLFAQVNILNRGDQQRETDGAVVLTRGICFEVVEERPRERQRRSCKGRGAIGKNDGNFMSREVLSVIYIYEGERGGERE